MWDILIIALFFSFALFHWVPLYLHRVVRGEERYHELLKKLSLKHGILQTQWFHNGRAIRFLRNVGMSSRWRRIWRVWFNVGMVLSLFFGLVTMVLLVLLVFQGIVGLFKTGEKTVKGVQLGGVSIAIPYSSALIRLPYLLLSMAIGVVFHELGHALCASSEDVEVEEFGLNCFVFFMSAYVALSSLHLSEVSNLSRIRIYLAGVWHNLVLSLFSAFVLFYFLHPGSPLSFVRRNHGQLKVFSVASSNPLHRDLARNEIIENINGCLVSDDESWKQCIVESQFVKYCLPKSEIASFQQLYAKNCCTTDDERLLCFRNQKSIQDTVCVPPLNIISKSKCTKFSCPQSQDCLELGEEDFQLLSVKVKGRDDSLLYYGYFGNFFHEVIVTDLEPNGMIASIFPLGFYYHLSVFFKFIFLISVALAMLNILPLQLFDGEKVFEEIIDTISRPGEGRRILQKIYKILQVICLLLVILAVMLLIVCCSVWGYGNITIIL